MKNIIPITMGDIKLPRIIPSLNQALFKGDKKGELIKPKTKKIIENISDQILKSSFLNKGKIETIKKKTKNTSPKLLFDGIFTFWFMVNEYTISIHKKTLNISIIIKNY